MTQARHEEQQQEWFEVFFDLVFAVAVALWAERLSRETSLTAYLRTGGVLLPIWWVWLGQTAFATRFPAGSLTIQALSIVQVIGVGTFTADLSATGLFAVTEALPAEGALAPIALDLPDGQPATEVIAVVIRRAQSPERGVALQFVAADDPFRERLDRYLARTAKI